MTSPPPWIDDLFSFPTPPALRTLIDIAWKAAYAFYEENESYDYGSYGTTRSNSTFPTGPADAFADQEPDVADALTDAARAIDAGHPATALLGLKDAFVTMPDFPFAAAKPLWAQAYQDLGRSELAGRLELMP